MTYVKIRIGNTLFFAPKENPCFHKALLNLVEIKSMCTIQIRHGKVRG